MISYEMHPYTLQSYFMNVCKSAYFAHEQLIRVRKDLEKAETKLTNMKEELKNLDSPSPEEKLKRRIRRTRKIRKKEKISEHEAKTEILRSDEQFWRRSFQNLNALINNIVSEIINQHFQIIVTNKEVLFGVMLYFISYERSEEAYQVVNTNGYFMDFFNKEEMNKEFIDAYLEKDKEKMKNVFNKYFA